MPAGRAGAAPLAIEVADANASFDPRGERPVVNIRLTPSSARLFADFTTQQRGQFIEIRVGGRVVSRPRIVEPILGGMIQISGSSTIEEAKDFAKRLSGGTGRLRVEAISELPFRAK